MKIPSDLDALLTWAESWLPTLAPADLVGPVYVIDRPLPAAIAGLTSGDMDLAYQKEIGRRRWRGRGAAILLDLDKFRLDEKRLREVSYADDETIRTMQGYVAMAVLRALLHEFGHSLKWMPLPPTPRHNRAAIDDVIWNPRPAADSRLPPPFDDHGGDFARVCLHLRWRAARGGVVVPLARLAGGLEYRMAKIESYRVALGNEPWRLRDASFQTIAKTRPPRKFADLWQRDVSAWLRSCAAAGPITDEIFYNAVWAADSLLGCEITRQKLAVILADKTFFSAPANSPVATREINHGETQG